MNDHSPEIVAAAFDQFFAAHPQSHRPLSPIHRYAEMSRREILRSLIEWHDFIKNEMPGSSLNSQHNQDLDELRDTVLNTFDNACHYLMNCKINNKEDIYYAIRATLLAFDLDDDLFVGTGFDLKRLLEISCSALSPGDVFFSGTL